jgi:hypothetical protein
MDYPPTYIPKQSQGGHGAIEALESSSASFGSRRFLRIYCLLCSLSYPTWSGTAWLWPTVNPRARLRKRERTELRPSFLRDDEMFMRVGIILVRIFSLCSALGLSPQLAVAASNAQEVAPVVPPVVVVTPRFVAPTEDAGEPEAPVESSVDETLTDVDSAATRILLKDPFVDFALSEEAMRVLDAESRGRYSSTRESLTTCKAIPIHFVWKEFAPFFNYRWDASFRNFAALLLAVWHRESRFAKPAKGVQVNPNCGGMNAKVIAPLEGVSLRRDLERARGKDAALSRAFAGCNLRLADFGPLQWNFRWRLTGDEFREDIEHALLLTTQYRASEIKRLENTQIASVVKFNPKALFLLGGLSLRDGAKSPVETIRAYNTAPEYRSSVNAKRLSILRTLEREPGCSPLRSKGAKPRR